jgi:hypothetical protein
MKVKYLSDAQIEAAASRSIAGYSGKFGPITPPVPVDEILECYYGVNFGIEDLRKYGSDVLGATWLDTNRVAVDESLDPSVYPEKEGRYRFTLAHELGHMELHSHQIMENGQGTLFDGSDRPTIICRSASNTQMEWQADNFAAYLLMPADMVYKFWRALFGDKPYYAAKEETTLRKLFCNRRMTLSVALDMADHFAVSGVAMQIRLENLKLIRHDFPETELF